MSTSTLTSSRDNQESISTVFEYLLKRSGMTVTDLASKIDVSRNTLYSLCNRCSTRADLNTLKKIADYFQEDISIFCGLKMYRPAVKLNQDEEALLKDFRALSGQYPKMAMKIVSSMAEGGSDEAVFLEKFASLSDKAQERVMEMIDDMLEVPKNRRQNI